MSVAWVDEPGSELASRTDAIDFTVSARPAFISVRFGEQRVEELAYRDGEFFWPYLSSTISEANTIALRRTGGWPRDATVHVEESVSTAWRTLYEIDFTALANRTVIAGGTNYGTFSLDNKTWSFHTSNSQSNIEILAGLGLRMQSMGHQGAGNPYDGARVSILAHLLPGYNALEQTVVQAVFRRPVAADPALANAFIGTQAWTDGDAPGWGYGAGNNGCVSYIQNALSGHASGARHLQSQVAPYAKICEYARFYPLSPQTSFCTASKLSADRRHQASYSFHAPTGVLEGFPNVEDMDPVLASQGGAYPYGGMHMGLYFAGEYPNMSDAYAMRMRILQKPETSL